MSKPRIFINMHYLELGGAEMALIGLLNAFDPEKVDVDLFIHSHRGELMKFIPPHINLLPEIGAYSVLESPIKDAVKEGHVAIASGRVIAKFRHLIYSKRNKPGSDDASILQYVANCTTPLLPEINDRIYDLAISFLTPHNICRDKVHARRKIAWIHTDYSTVSVNPKLELPVWRAFDHIASISDDVTRSFIKTFPSLANKIIDVENIISPEFVRRRAEEFDASIEIGTAVPDSQSKNKTAIKLLSIGRFCTAKNYDNVPDICRRMRESGLNVRWYIIGFGGSEELIREKIAAAGMADHVILLGKKSNPYPYIKACDVYVQPSRYEGKSITVREAQILCKPVAVTNYPTAPSQIRNGIDGVIVPIDNEGCARGLVDFLSDRKKQNDIIEYLKTHDYGNISEVEKLYDLLK